MTARAQRRHLKLAQEPDDLGAKTIWFPYMCDHVAAILGALRHHGLQGRELPPPDDETLAIGLDLCLGRECLPCFLCTGDIVRACRNGVMDPARSAVFMPAGPGPCRFGQYRHLQRTLLDREGFNEVEILSPTSENSYRGFGDRPHALRLLVWQGVVAVDLLLKLLYEFRPYERVPGITEAAYQRGLVAIEEASARGGGRHLVAAMDGIAADFAGLDVDRSTARPVVLVVGEIYVMLNVHSNQEIIRQLEVAGAEVVTGTLGEWLHFADETQMDREVLFGSWVGLLGTKGLSVYKRRVERKLHARVAHLLRQPPDAPMRELLNLARPYFDPLIGTEATLTLGKVADLARYDVAGVVNVMPFSCMPGIIVAGIAAAVRRDFGQLPWLDVIYDGQRITNIRTRLEAFVHQVTQFARNRRARAGAGAANAPRSAATS
jgi:predicted nucleotide-binding protein (sugar kinase/HSP70/actin superfamily)